MSDIAEKVGLSTSSIGDIATGRTESPRGDAALKLYELHKSTIPTRPKSKQVAV